MPRPRLGALPMTAAERQARRRAKLRRLGDTLTARRVPRGPPGRGVGRLPSQALMALQDEYRAWLDRLPESLAGSKTADSCKRSPSSTSTSARHRAATRLRPRLTHQTRGGHCAVPLPAGAERLPL